MTIIILDFILNIVYEITKLCKIKKNKITFISYKSNKLEEDFKLIANRLIEQKKYDLKFILIKYKKSILGDLLYLINCVMQVYHINTSSIVLLDYNNYAVSKFKKKGVKVVQIWHASGAIKKFGNDVKRKYKIKGYDYVLTTSSVWKKYYSTAFNVEEEKVVELGIPRNDILFSKSTIERYVKSINYKFPSIRNKKVILFAPTFRGNYIKGIRYEKIDLEYIQSKLGDDYIIIYKLHPWIDDNFIYNSSKVINANNVSIAKLLSIADYLISDYSSVIFDFSIFEKPIILYTPDLEEYKENPGIYLDYENEIPGPICKNEDEIIKTIQKDYFSIEKVKKFKNKFFKYQDELSTERVVNFIEKLMED